MSENEAKPQDNGLTPQNNAETPPLKNEDLSDGPPPSIKAGRGEPMGSPMYSSRNLRFMQLSLAACVVLTAAVVCYLFFGHTIRAQATAQGDVLAPATSSDVVLTKADRGGVKAQNDVQTIASSLPAEPVSLYTAVQYYKQGDYEKALNILTKLRSSLTPADNESFNDYLLLCSAICNLKIGNSDQAVNYLKTSSQSEFNFVRLCANYYLCQLELSKNQFDSVSARAYQAIALVESVASDEKIAGIRSDCEYFAAIAQTKILTGLSDADEDAPPDLYQKNLANYDVILDVDETKLKQILADQQYKFQAGILSPSIERCKPAADADTNEQSPLNLLNCSVITYGCSIEELMSRFASNFSLELNWDIKNDLQTIRQRPVRLYMTQCTVEQFIQTAAGAAALAAEINGGVIKIYNPSDYTVLSEHLDTLYGQAVLLWQKFMISRFQDERICNAHFALAALYTGKNNIPQAIDEFKLVASKHSQSKIAPYALLQSARLKIGLKDLAGANQDLRELVEQYPDCRIADKAYILLADIISVQGDKLGSGKLFAKVYNLNYSAQSQQTAAINAAQAFYETTDYESAILWATKYINIAKNIDKNSLCKAYLLVGKIYLAWEKFDKGCSALRFAIEGQLTKEEYKDTVFSLLDGYIKKQNYIDALDVLGNINSWQFSEHEFMQLLIIKSRIYRDMGLYGKAIAALADKAEYVSEKQLKSQMLYEIALSQIASDNLNLGYNTLMDTVAICEPGELNDKITATLAALCLKLNRNEQAYNLCLGLINNSPSQEVKQQAKQFMAEVYRRQNNFDKAALALLGVSEKTE